MNCTSILITARACLRIIYITLILAVLVLIGRPVYNTRANALTDQPPPVKVDGFWVTQFGGGNPDIVELTQNVEHVDGQITSKSQTKLGLLTGNISTDGSLVLDVFWYKAKFPADIKDSAWSKAVDTRGDANHKDMLKSRLSLKYDAGRDELNGTYTYVTIEVFQDTGEFDQITTMDVGIRFAKLQTTPHTAPGAKVGYRP